MSRVARRIINALSIPSHDVYEIGPNVVAVNPIWKIAIQRWVGDNGQRWYRNWFDKGYLATKVSVGSPSTQYVWCIHRGPLTDTPTTLAEQCVRYVPMGLGLRNTNDTPLVSIAQGIVAAHVAAREGYDESYQNGGPVAEIVPIVGVQKQFAGTAFGANVNFNVPMRLGNNYMVGAGPSVKITGTYVSVGSMKPVALPSPMSNMLLIEGPSTFDYGEVSPWYEFFLVMNATIRQDMTAANEREPSLKLRADSSELDNDPTGGLGYLKMTVKTSINPFDMIANFRPYADEIFQSNQTIESVAMSDIRKCWASESVFVGGFAGDETLRTSFPKGVTDDDTAEALAMVDAKTAHFTIRSSDAVLVDATPEGGTTVTGTLTADLAVIVAKRLSMRGVQCTISTYGGLETVGEEVSISSLMSRMVSATHSGSVVARAQRDLRTEGQTDQVGYSTLVATAKLMSYDQRMIASTLLIPGMVYDNTTAGSIAK